MLPEPEITAAEVEVPQGSSLHLFSDGVFEVVDRDGRQLGLEDILPSLSLVAPLGDDGDPRRLYDHVRAIAKPGQLTDDFSALVFRFT
jgi:serine phosphatase RsbU (regulator of sigma subunit)